MEAQNAIATYFSAYRGRFDEIFMEMFVELNGSFNYRFFNEVHEAKFTHAELNKAIEAVSGKKLIKYVESEYPIDKQSMVFKLFKRAYEFGKYENARYWIRDIYVNTEVVLPRTLVLGWIAKQRPDRVTSSFAPVNDGNLYHASEKESFSKPNKRTDAEIAE